LLLKGYYGINQHDYCKGKCLSHTHWNILPKPDQIAEIPGIHPIIVQILYNRGVQQPADIESFIANDERVETNPFLIPDMPLAVLRTHQALLSGERIAVYGDFDADGITATAMLVQGLTALGANVIPYIPNRATEGYGLRAAALEKLKEKGVSLIITCDTGVTAAAEVEIARKHKIDIIVTDHHVPVGQLPNAKAVVDPKRSDSQFPFKDLAGVGVAYKFMQALVADKNRDDILEKCLDLVAIGTITDMVTMVSENRYWVKKGLQLLNNTNRIGLQEILRTANIQKARLTEQTVSWAIGPRINAAGRIDSANTSYRLLVTEDRSEASYLAAELERKNAERIQQTSELLTKVRESIIAEGTEQPLLMAAGDDYHSGVMGLVAGRLADKYYRPVIVVKVGKESCRGSGRSIPEFDIIGALTECQDLLTRFGGHTRAAGLNLATKDLPEFKKKILQLAKNKLDGLDLRPHIDIDAEIPLSNINRDLYEQIQRLAPFGIGNSEPVFVSRSVAILDIRQMGNNGEHLRLKLKHGRNIWDAVGWGLGENAVETYKFKFLDIVYNLELNHWNGEENLRLNIQDFSPSS